MKGIREVKVVARGNCDDCIWNVDIIDIATGSIIEDLRIIEVDIDANMSVDVNKDYVIRMKKRKGV